MKNAKRVQAVALSAFLTLSMVLTGCSKGQPETAQPTASSAAKESLAPYVIDWYYTGSGPQPDQALIEGELNNNIKDINATVKLHPFDSGTYTQKMQTILATGEKVDLFFSATWGSNIYANVKGGYVVDLTDMIDKYAPHAKEVLKDGFLQGSRIDGKNYALPVNKEKAQSMGVLLNKNLVDKYSFDISKVKSIKDLEPMFKVIKEKEPNVYPCEATQSSGPAMTISMNYISNIAGASYDMLGGTDKFIPRYEDKAYLDIWNTAHDFFQKGYIRKDAATIKNATADEKSGKIFAAWSGLKPGKDAEMTASTGVEWVQVPLTKVYSSAGDLMGSMMAVGKTSKDPARVLMFYDKFYNDSKIVNLMDYGIEGKHYVKKGDNVIDYAPETDGGKKSGWKPGTPWMFGNQFLSYLFTTEDPKKWEKFKEFNNQAIAMPTNGFVFDGESLKNETVALSNVLQEFGPGLDTGTMDPEVYVPKFKEKLNAAGLQKVLDEANKQYSDWKTKTKK